MTSETPNSSQNNPFQTFPQQQQLTPTPSAKTKTELNEYGPISAPQSHYDYELSTEMQTIVPSGHESPFITTEKFQFALLTDMQFPHSNIRSLKEKFKKLKNLIEPMQNSLDVIWLTKDFSIQQTRNRRAEKREED